MTAATANPVSQFPNAGEYPSLKKFLWYSLFLHAGLAALVVTSVIIKLTGNQWSGMGGTQGNEVKVNLVSSAGIPMPPPPDITDSRTFDPTNSLFKAEVPKPSPPKVDPPKPADAIKLPKFEKEKRPKGIQHPSKTFDTKAPPPDNAIPGNGGRLTPPTGTNDTPGAGAQQVVVQGAGGDFASRYGWYIEAVKRRINQSWLQNTIDPAVRAARQAHSVVQFTINRDGSVKDIRLQQSSGNSSMDTSGIRAIYAADHFDRLPSDYSGSYVVVTFDFDLAMKN
jgi:TonB family protein